MALSLMSLVQSFGYEATGPCVSGTAALEQAALQKPDLVLMDINLRGEMDGIEVARRLQDVYGCKVVFVTGQGDQKTRQRAEAIGPAGYVVKPFRQVQLEKVIRRALQEL